MPVCAVCGGLANAVDHRIAVSEAPHLAFTISNLQAICRTCNSRKNAKRRAELANQAIKQAREGTAGALGYPPRREW